MANVRVSCNKIAAVGKPSRADWSTQSQRFHAKKRGATLNNQLLLSHELPEGHEMVQVKSIHTNHNDGKVYGITNGRKVVRDGYAYSLTAHGRTPGRWLYV